MSSWLSQTVAVNREDMRPRLRSPAGGGAASRGRGLGAHCRNRVGHALRLLTVKSDLELCYLGAVEARNRFADRSLSPVELVTNFVARIEDVEPRVNAFTHTFFDRALGDAREVEKRYAGRGARLRLLEGLPLVIKDFHDVKGEVTTYGSRLYEHHRPRKSLAYVDRLLRAGAILLARTTTPEFALLGVTHSELWGVTRNPWNLDFSPGASSGGAGAAHVRFGGRAGETHRSKGDRALRSDPTPTCRPGTGLCTWPSCSMYLAARWWDGPWPTIFAPSWCSRR